MKLVKGLEAVDLCLWLPESGTLAMSDLHLGYEGMMNAQGVFLPRVNFDAIRKRLAEKVFPKIGRPGKIVINGDFKQEFGTISRQEWKEAVEMLDFLSGHCDEIILVKGNHDTVLGPIAEWKSVRLTDRLFSENEGVLFLHGDREPAVKDLSKAETIVIGHAHPCVTVRDGVKRETYKCFLIGKYRRKNLVVLPSMNQLALGEDMTKGRAMSPLVKNLADFKVYAVEDGPYYMGKLKNLL